MGGSGPDGERPAARGRRRSPRLPRFPVFRLVRARAGSVCECGEPVVAGEQDRVPGPAAWQSEPVAPIGSDHAAGDVEQPEAEAQEPQRRRRAFNQLKNWRGLATRYDKHALVYRGGRVLAAILLWLR